MLSVAKIFSVLIAAAVIVGGATALSGASEKTSVTVVISKADRLDARFTGLDCSQQAWPYYEASCVKDRRDATSQAKPARIVTADRVPATVKR